MKRYDTSHGHLHVHIFWHGEQVEDLEPQSEPASDHAVAAANASHDLRANFLQYRSFMEE